MLNPRYLFSLPARQPCARALGHYTDVVAFKMQAFLPRGGDRADCIASSRLLCRSGMAYSPDYIGRMLLMP